MKKLSLMSVRVALARCNGRMILDGMWIGDMRTLRRNFFTLQQRHAACTD
jgi:hypothetical protein